MENFEQLAEQYEPMIHHIIRSLHIYKNTDEFYQTGLIALWEAKERFNPDKGKFSSFAYMYIKGRLLSEMTDSNKHEINNIYLKDEHWELIEDCGNEQSVEVQFISSFCGGLTENQKMWVLYTVIYDLSITEIADKEQVSVSAVKAWRKGAKKKLKDSLEIRD